MSKFPVEVSDQEGIVAAVNYVLSGPTYPDSSAQGFTSDKAANLTGNFREPWTRTLYNPLYIPPIALSTVTWLSDNCLRFDFAAAEPTPPFALGNNLYVAGTSDYDGFYAGPGVVECTTTYVIIRTRTNIPNYGPNAGGTIEYNAADPNLAPTEMSTDCNTKVTVNYANSQVTLNAQLKNDIQYAAYINTDAIYQVQINRYKAYPNNDLTNPGFFFDYDTTVAAREYSLYLPSTQTNAVTADIDPAPPVPYTNTRTAAALTYPETYRVQSTTNLTGPGLGIELDVKIAANFPAVPGDPYLAANTTITVIQGGENYQLGDQILIDGADIGGVTGVDDLVIVLTQVGISNPILNYETVFSGVVDRPPIGYYWYILEVYFEKINGSLEIYQCLLGQRSLTAQVIKQ